jgi:hypothetical protein
MGMTNVAHNHEVSLHTTDREDDSLSKDEIFELLKNRRRRDVLEYLLAVDRTVTLSELAEHIAAWENDVDVQALNSSQRKRVYVALYQTHLPKMDQTGIVEYNQDRGRISLSENASVLETYLDRGYEETDRWHRRYVALSAAGIALVAVVGVSNSGGWLELGLSFALVTAFLALSLYHTYDTRGGAPLLSRFRKDP